MLVYQMVIHKERESTGDVFCCHTYSFAKPFLMWLGYFPWFTWRSVAASPRSVGYPTKKPSSKPIQTHKSQGNIYNVWSFGACFSPSTPPQMTSLLTCWCSVTFESLTSETHSCVSLWRTSWCGPEMDSVTRRLGYLHISTSVEETSRWGISGDWWSPPTKVFPSSDCMSRPSWPSIQS